MKIIFSVIFIVTFFASDASAQAVEQRKGNVSFLSSKNVYVKFTSTDGISEGDTLYVNKEGRLAAVLTAKFISPGSAAGELLNGTDVKVGDEIFALIKIPEKEIPPAVETGEVFVPEEQVKSKTRIKEITLERINGRFSVQSYTNISNSDLPDFQRWRYTFSFSGMNLNESPFSVITYFNFNYRADEWYRFKDNAASNFRIYDFAVKYDLSERSYVIAGRHLNEKITNISPIDGLQYQQAAGDFNLGAFAGSRPDFSNMGFNLKLFQAGVYVNRTDTINAKTIDNTFAVVQQTNNFKTDRRLLYFQHMNNYLDDFTFFLSAEADLYKKINNQQKNELSLTGLFVSARYSPFRIASFSVSYDARRNVIYYETFRNYLETLLENEMRQGFRASINLHPFDQVFAGINSGYRFRKGDPHPSNDFGAFISYSMIPVVEISPSLSYSRISSAFISGNIFGAAVSKSIAFLNSDVYAVYRHSEYSLPGNQSQIQNSVMLNLGTRIIRQIFFSIGWEGIFEGKRTTGRILADLTTRL